MIDTTEDLEQVQRVFNVVDVVPLRLLMNDRKGRRRNEEKEQVIECQPQSVRIGCLLDC